MNFFRNLLNSFMEMDILDVLDICLVWILLYLACTFIRERRAGKLAVGVMVMLALQLVSDALELRAMQSILQNVFQVGLIALIVVFQPELRSALEKVGAEPFKSIKSFTDDRDINAYNEIIDNICEAVCDMSLDKTGALIVIERGTKLEDFIRSGTIINSDVSSFLLKNIFFNKAPLHDGAVIIRDTKIRAAGCFLPLSTNVDIVKDLGTRHRAAIGMSENSDAAVIVVSEENGIISIAFDGKLTRNYDYTGLRKALCSFMLPKAEKTQLKKRIFKKESEDGEYDYSTVFHAGSKGHDTQKRDHTDKTERHEGVDPEESPQSSDDLKRYDGMTEQNSDYSGVSTKNSASPDVEIAESGEETGYFGKTVAGEHKPDVKENGNDSGRRADTVMSAAGKENSGDEK